MSLHLKKLTRSLAKIFLVGMPGSGKSTIGSQVASNFGIDFFDLDILIESNEKSSIAKIFETHGERHFREAERSLLRSAIESNKHFLMATGGGTPCFYDNLIKMKEVGATIFINPLIETIISRLSTSNLQERPKLNETDLDATLRETYGYRLPYYKKADYELFGKEADATGLSALIESILKM